MPPPSAQSESGPPRIAIIQSRYNESVTAPLREGALAVYAKAYEAASCDVFPAPGSYELIALATAAAESGRYDGIVCLGCIIKGETRHDEYLAAAVAQALSTITVGTGIPVAFGVLTVDSPQQAADRAGGAHGNKGEEAMEALLETLATIEHIHSGEEPIQDFADKPDKGTCEPEGGA